MTRTCLVVILAAGEGTRMRSTLPKVLHPVAGRPMVSHVIATARAAGADACAVVVGREAERVRAVAGHDASLRFFEQHERLGTAHAVLAAREAIADGYDDLLVLFGDTPLLQPEILSGLRDVRGDNAVAVLGFRTPRPQGYGRILEVDGQVVAIREDKDASEAERAVTFCNGGIMAIDGRMALDLLDRIGNDNAKGEYYLTDIVALARQAGRGVVAAEADVASLIGVNTRVELAEVEALWQQRRRRELMLAGVTMIAPETVHLAFDTRIEPDCVIEPNVVFGPGVTVGSGAVVHAFCHMEGASVEAGASVGPFARLRPGTRLAAGARIGNFCEIKNAEIGVGAKVNHLSYIGDASVGREANIGAGTITCNYDGVAKHRTTIGAGAFIGSNSALVAPVSIGDGGYVASGSVITTDVPDDALGIARGRQTNREGYASAIRARSAARKAGARGD